MGKVLKCVLYLILFNIICFLNINSVYCIQVKQLNNNTMTFILSFFTKLIGSIFSAITRKILIAFVIFLLLHALVVSLTGGTSISYGTALGEVAKADSLFIFSNIESITSTIWSNIVDFSKSVK